MSSSYKALARKYRPMSFSSLIGQDVLVQTLSNAIEFNMVHHAYLLTGIRGVGKTTTARIIAKNLNCDLGPTSKPCLKCTNCTSITEGNHPDVLEFDAASNTGIDDVKTLLEGIIYAPSKGRKKIYIIDEIHMLSTKAFNSLLKTLEEPPSDIIFIFATTEFKKVPITILSRCQKFFLRSLSITEISNHIKHIAGLEGVEITNEASDIIAKKADGSVRDSLSLLDQVIVVSKTTNIGKIDQNLINSSLGIPSLSDIVRLAECVLTKPNEVSTITSMVDKILSSGSSEQSILTDLFDVFNAVLLQKYNSLHNNEIQPDALSIITSLSVLSSSEKLIHICDSIANSILNFHISLNPKTKLNLAILKLCHISILPPPTEIIERLKDKDLNAVINSLSDFSNVSIS